MKLIITDIKKESDEALFSIRDRLYSMMEFLSPYTKEFYEVSNEYNDVCHELYVRGLAEDE